MEVRGESVKNSLAIFIFPNGAAQVIGKTHLANSCEKRWKRCQESGEIVFSLLYLSSVIGVCVCVCLGGFAWVCDESWTPVSKLEQRLQVWPVHGACLLVLLQMFVFPLVVGVRVRKDGWERERLFKNQLGECRQGSASWLCGPGWRAGRFLQVDYSALSHGKQSVKMTQSRVTAPHASLW